MSNIRREKYVSIASALGGAMTAELTRSMDGDGGGPQPTAPPFYPTQLFANGELGYFRYAGNERALYSDIAKATLITTEAATIGSEKDFSPNNIVIRQITPASRPALKLLPASSRRVVDYTVGGTSTTIVTPAMGNQCTLIRARPGIGAVISTNLTINGTQTTNTNVCAEMLINRALTPLETANALAWFNNASGQMDEFNVAYGPDPDHRLDIYHSTGHPGRPIIIMCHGGGWRNGDKLLDNVVKNKLQHWLPQGFTFVSINYPMAIGVTPVEEAHSFAKAVKFIADRAVSMGCDPSKIVTMGHSAGANIMMQFTASRALRESEGFTGNWLGSVAIDSAAYDVTVIMNRPDHQSLYDEPWGTDPALWIAGSPTLILDCIPPPSLLITSTTTNPGESDNNVGPYQDAVALRGGPVPVILHTDLDHGGTNSDLGLFGTDYTAAVDAFFASIGLPYTV